MINIKKIGDMFPDPKNIVRQATDTFQTAKDKMPSTSDIKRNVTDGLENIKNKISIPDIGEGIRTGIDRITDIIPNFGEPDEIINLDSKDLSLDDYKKALANLETDNSFDYSSLATSGIGGVAGVGAIAATGFKVTLFGLSVFALPAWPILAAGGLAGAAVGYGIYKWNHKNGMEAYIKEALKQDLREKIEKQRKEMTKLDREKKKILVADNILIAAFKRKAKEEDFKDLQDLMSLLISDGAEPETINETLESLF